MISHHRAVLGMCVVALATVATAEDLAAKCSDATVPGYVLIVNDRVVGEYGMDTAMPDLSTFATREEIYSITVDCRTLPSGARQPMVLITTKTGYRSVVELHLRELVERQRAWHADGGRYRELSEIGFYGSAKGLVPIETTATETGWSGTVRPKGLDLACYVVVGSAAPQRPGLQSGVPACFSEPAA